jgi:hypothetical protein
VLDHCHRPLEYFLKQWELFLSVPGSILAHSTHVKGMGIYDPDTGVETPRIVVTLATDIPEERCRGINLGYADYRDIDPEAWKGREEEGILYVPHAGALLKLLVGEGVLVTDDSRFLAVELNRPVEETCGGHGHLHRLLPPNGAWMLASKHRFRSLHGCVA